MTSVLEAIMGTFDCRTPGKLVLRKALCVLRSQDLKDEWVLSMLRGQHGQKTCGGRVFDYWEKNVSVLGVQREASVGVR